MAEKLIGIYEDIKRIGGLPATIRLANLSGITAIEAQNLPDVPALIEELEDCYNIVKQRYEASSPEFVSSIIENNISQKTVQSLRRQIEAVSDLLTVKSISETSTQDALKKITTAISNAIDVERASIWFFDDDKTCIRCAMLYERLYNRHTSGHMLCQKDFPSYFRALEQSKTISTENAQTHQATSEFTKQYLVPNGIGSMLDVPILHGSEAIGVVCHEHVGSTRKWTSDEENFAYVIGQMVGVLLDIDVLLKT